MVSPCWLSICVALVSHLPRRSHWATLNSVMSWVRSISCSQVRFLIPHWGVLGSLAVWGVLLGQLFCFWAPGRRAHFPPSSPTPALSRSPLLLDAWVPQRASL